MVFMENIPGRLIKSQHILPSPTSWAHDSQANHPQQVPSPEGSMQ